MMLRHIEAPIPVSGAHSPFESCGQNVMWLLRAAPVCRHDEEHSSEAFLRLRLHSSFSFGSQWRLGMSGYTLPRTHSLLLGHMLARAPLALHLLFAHQQARPASPPAPPAGLRLFLLRLRFFLCCGSPLATSGFLGLRLRTRFF